MNAPERHKPERGRPARRPKLPLASKGALLRLGVLVLLAAGAAVWAYRALIVMPGDRYEGPVPELEVDQMATMERLKADVEMLAGTIGVRNVYYPDAYARAAEWIETELAGMGYDVHRQFYDVDLPEEGVEGVTCTNIWVELAGRDNPDEIVIIGAHYDTFGNSPGANDNGSGVVATLELARRFADARPGRTLRFVFFANEEPPIFQTDQMGSLVYARSLKQREENVVGMISLETIGYFSDEEGSQQYPAPVGMMYPERGDFIGFVSNIRSRRLLKEVVEAFRTEATIPSEGGALFGGIPGVGWSDHWAFWQVGYPALMVTDTALYRYPHYHLPTDTPDRLDYERLALVVDGLEVVTTELARIRPAAAD